MIFAYVVICVGGGLVLGALAAIAVMLMQGKDIR